MLEIVLVLLLILVFLLIVYKGAIHEFQILQKDWKPTIDWSALLSEQLPIVIRNVDPVWQGSWTRKANATKTWPIQVRGEDGALYKGYWNEWIASPPGQPPLTSETIQELSEVVAPPVSSWEDGGFRRWSWIPAHLTRTPQRRVIGPQEIQPVRTTTAAATVVQATDGAPLTIWLAHEGSVPAKVVPALLGQDPWSLHEDSVPWISEVKFIEIRLRPGNALVIPTHWYWAMRGESVGTAESMGDGSWVWIAEWQTPISWIVSKARKGKAQGISGY